VVAVVVAAIGAGAYLLRFHESPIAREEAETLVAKNATVARRRPSAGGLSAEALTGRQSVVAPPEVPAPARPTPASSAPIEAPAKAVRSPIPSTRLIESLVVTALETEAPPPVDASPTPDVVATAPPRPSAPPVSPFFQTTDVNESPRVATRVEPLVPDELRARPLNEIVVVRVLVSQGGHPSRISLLRRSKAGPRLDNAVMAAVNQWTFSPARKSGEAVSCWFNVGVPVGGAD
jgi:protein TonB